MMLEESAAAATAGLGGGDAAAAAAESGSSSSDDPRGMAELLFGVGEPTPQQCYQAFRLLEGRDGVLFFKRRRDGTYECRTRWVRGAGVVHVLAEVCHVSPSFSCGRNQIGQQVYLAKRRVDWSL